VPSKFDGWGDDQFRDAGFRAVPGAIVRKSAFIAKNVVLMPSFVNLGAYVDESSMVDTWSTVGSCAQIGKRVHISGGVGIGGVLEPLQAGPVIIEDDCFIGARSEVAEGVIVRKGAVLAMGVFLGASTKIVDRETGEVFVGEVPEYAVLVPGNLPGKPMKNGQIGPSTACAVIVKRVDERTRSKTSINELLRDWGVGRIGRFSVPDNGSRQNLGRHSGAGVDRHGDGADPDRRQRHRHIVQQAVDADPIDRFLGILAGDQAVEGPQGAGRGEGQRAARRRPQHDVRPLQPGIERQQIIGVLGRPEFIQHIEARRQLDKATFALDDLATDFVHPTQRGQDGGFIGGVRPALDGGQQGCGPVTGPGCAPRPGDKFRHAARLVLRRETAQGVRAIEQHQIPVLDEADAEMARVVEVGPRLAAGEVDHQDAGEGDIAPGRDGAGARAAAERRARPAQAGPYRPGIVDRLAALAADAIEFAEHFRAGQQFLPTVLLV
jgi:2,3,4,5-tetrahydropyridine-2,6-dicarboxylate N-succinyltransferase